MLTKYLGITVQIRSKSKKLWVIYNSKRIFKLCLIRYFTLTETRKVTWNTLIHVFSKTWYGCKIILDSWLTRIEQTIYAVIKNYCLFLLNVIKKDREQDPSRYPTPVFQIIQPERILQNKWLYLYRPLKYSIPPSHESGFGDEFSYINYIRYLIMVRTHLSFKF